MAIDVEHGQVVMLEIVAVPAFSDNYLWLVHDDDSGQTAVVDPGDATPYAVQTDSFLLARLPLRVGPFTLRPRSGILHLETD